MHPATELINKLERLKTIPPRGKVMVGFDGYVDHILKVVASSHGNKKVYYQSLDVLGKHIAAAAGKSAQLELRTLTTKLGGNAPIMANALGWLGVDNYCVGTMGYPDIHPDFAAMHTRCSLLSIGEPARTHALELGDGKLILSEVSTFDDLDFASIGKHLTDNSFAGALMASDLIALVDWSNLPHGTALWKDLSAEVARLRLKNKTFFFDLCDPSKKSPEEIGDVMDAIGRYRALGRTVLGLNENEACRLYEAFLQTARIKSPGDASGLGTMANRLYAAINVDVLLIHPVDRAIAVTDGGLIECMGRVVPDPKILTGGGDNLNAGFCFGLLAGFSLPECMMLGMATSGAYVQNGASPGIDEILTYIKQWPR